MGLFDRFKKSSKDTVTVTFINHADQSIIGQCELQPEQLPETFEINTTMHLGDDNWEVMSAEPSQKVEFIKKGELTLVMQKVEMVNPNDILFSLPTINNELPALSENTLSDVFVITMLEDDWRQCEFFSKNQHKEIQQEIEKIEQLKANHQKSESSQYNAYDKIHIRELADLALLSINFKELQAILKVKKIGAIKFENQSYYIAQGFALETDHHIYYGVLDSDNEVVETLGVRYKSDNIDEIAHVLNAFDLVYVDWCETSCLE